MSFRLYRRILNRKWRFNCCNQAEEIGIDIRPSDSELCYFRCTLPKVILLTETSSSAISRTVLQQLRNTIKHVNGSRTASRRSKINLTSGQGNLRTEPHRLPTWTVRWYSPGDASVTPMPWAHRVQITNDISIGSAVLHG